MEKYKTVFRRFLSVLLAVVCMLSVELSALALPEKPLVRIGYNLDDNMVCFRNDEYYGFVPDIVNAIGRFGDFDVEYVGGKSQDLLAMLKNGDIDTVCTSPNDEFANGNFPVGIDSLVLVSKDEGQLYFDDFEHFEGMTVGYIKNGYGTSDNVRVSAVKDYAQKYGFSCNIKAFSDMKSMILALNNNQIDAVVMRSFVMRQTMAENNLKIVANLGAKYLYFLFAEENSDGKELIDSAMEKLVNTSPYYMADIHEKYYGRPRGVNTSLTRDEQEAVSALSEVNVIVEKNMPAFSYEDDGEIKGVCKALAGKIFESAGLKVSFSTSDTYTDGVNKVLNTSGNIIGACALSSSFKSENHLSYSSAFKIYNYRGYVKEGFTANEDKAYTIAVTNTTCGLASYIMDIYPNSVIQEYANEYECLLAVDSGKAHIAYLNPISAQYETVKLGASRMVFSNPALTLEVPFGFAYDRSISRDVQSALEKSINKLTVGGIDSCVNENACYIVDVNVFEYLYDNPFSLAIFCIILGAGIAAAIIAKYNHNVKTQLKYENSQLENKLVQTENSSTKKSVFLLDLSNMASVPVNSIIATMQEAKKNLAQQEDVKAGLSKIDYSAHYLLNLLNDVRDLAGIVSKTVMIEPKLFNVRLLLEKMLDSYRPLCLNGQKNLVLEINNLSCEMIYGDKSRLMQVLHYLILNAIQFTENGDEIKISLSETKNKDNICTLQFDISDNGIGMSEAFMERMYRPFEQERTVDFESKDNTELCGSGMGLPIAKCLCELLGGRMSADSKVGVGTVFTVEIPFGTKEFLHDCPLSGIKTLLISDRVEEISYFTCLFNLFGIEFEICNSIEQAELAVSKAAEKDKDFCYKICFMHWNSGKVDTDKVQRLRGFCKNDNLVLIHAVDEDYSIPLSQNKAIQAVLLHTPFTQPAVYNAWIEALKKVRKLECGDYEVRDFSNKHIIIAEDNAENMAVLVNLLKATGVKIHKAIDGKEAVALVKAHKEFYFDLILMDLQMPRLDGYDATKEIRGLKRIDVSQIPIVAMTANSSDEKTIIMPYGGINSLFTSL